MGIHLLEDIIRVENPIVNHKVRCTDVLVIEIGQRHLYITSDNTNMQRFKRAQLRKYSVSSRHSIY